MAPGVSACEIVIAAAPRSLSLSLEDETKKKKKSINHPLLFLVSSEYSESRCYIAHLAFSAATILYRSITGVRHTFLYICCIESLLFLRERKRWCLEIFGCVWICIRCSFRGYRESRSLLLLLLFWVQLR